MTWKRGDTFPMLVFDDSALLENSCQFLTLMRVYKRGLPCRWPRLVLIDSTAHSIQSTSHQKHRHWDTNVRVKNLPHVLVRISYFICCWTRNGFIDRRSPINFSTAIIKSRRIGNTISTSWWWHGRSKRPSSGFLWVQLVVRRHFLFNSKGKFARSHEAGGDVQRVWSHT